MRWTITLLFLLTSIYSSPWGFYAHKSINYHACFTLPQEMFGFYKFNIEQIREWAIRPDQRRYILESEGMKHYIDVDQYEAVVPLDSIPRHYDSAIAILGKEFVLEHGIAPWNIIWLKHKLTNAFEERDAQQIVKLSADLGHYIADVHVPLHTTQNYNGQLTNQHGIHGLWESRLPELFASEYDLEIKSACYIDDVATKVWNVVEASFAAKDSVLLFERVVSEEINAKFSFENRGKSVRKVYSKAFSEAYHHALNQMVERQMKQAIQTVGSLWYTCWVDAGEPILIFDQIKRAEDNSSLDSLIEFSSDSLNQRTHIH